MLPVFRIIACQLVPAAVVTVLIITENYIVFCADISDFPINNAAVRVVSAFGTGNRSSCDGRRKAHQQAYAYHSRQHRFIRRNRLRFFVFNPFVGAQFAPRALHNAAAATAALPASRSSARRKQAGPCPPFLRFVTQILFYFLCLHDSISTYRCQYIFIFYINCDAKNYISIESSASQDKNPPAQHLPRRHTVFYRYINTLHFIMPL